MGSSFYVSCTKGQILCCPSSCLKSGPEQAYHNRLLAFGRVPCGTIYMSSSIHAPGKRGPGGSMADGIDVLVIGGGVIGLSVAYYLSKKGASITVVEGSEIGAGSSRGNAGWLVPSYSIPLASPHSVRRGLKWMFDPHSPFHIEPRFDPELASWLWKFVSASKEPKTLRAIPILRDLNRMSLRLTRETIRQEGLRCHFHQNGVLSLFATESELRAGEEDARLLRRFGLEVEMLDRDEALRKAPLASSAIVGGMYSREDAHLDPYDFLEELAARVAERGVKIETGAPVVGFDTGNDRILTVKAGNRLLSPDVVVLAAGTWTGRLARKLRLSIPIQPARGYSVTVARPDDFTETPLMLGESKVVVTPLEGRIRLAGILEFAGFESAIPSGRIEAMVESAARYIRTDSMQFQDAETWAGLRPCTPDGLPVIGWAGQWKNLVVASGHCMLGISLAAATGKIVAQIVSGETPGFDMEPLRPCRFG